MAKYQYTGKTPIAFDGVGLVTEGQVFTSKNKPNHPLVKEVIEKVEKKVETSKKQLKKEEDN
jgi:hypothetical protein